MRDRLKPSKLAKTAVLEPGFLTVLAESEETPVDIRMSFRVPWNTFPWDKKKKFGFGKAEFLASTHLQTHAHSHNNGHRRSALVRSGRFLTLVDDRIMRTESISGIYTSVCDIDRWLPAQFRA